MAAGSEEVTRLRDGVMARESLGVLGVTITCSCQRNMRLLLYVVVLLSYYIQNDG